MQRTNIQGARMREKIKHYADGTFEYEKTRLLLSKEQLVLSVEEHQTLEGSFSLSSDTGKPVKGLVYTTTFRMEALNPAFRGRKISIRYAFDSQGMEPGETEEGAFTLITEAGEYVLPYRVTVLEAEKAQTPAETEDTQNAVLRDVPEVLSHRSEELFTEPEGPFSAERIRENCMRCISSQQTDREAFFWYSLGVTGDVKLMSLFEYYMYALPMQYEEAVPRQVQLYFLHNDSLDPAHRTRLYANLIRYVDKRDSVYQQYRKDMEAFMLQQLLLRRMNEELAVLYQEFLVEEILTKELAEALTEILFLRLLTCYDKRVRQVQVQYEELLEPLIFPVNRHGQAYIPVYTEDARIRLLDMEGNFLTDVAAYSIRRLLPEQEYADRCGQLVSDQPGLLLYLCRGNGKAEQVTEETAALYKQILQTEGFSGRFREEVRQAVLQYYYERQELLEADKELFIAEHQQMTAKERAKFVEMLIGRDMFKEAYRLIRRFGYSGVKLYLLVKLAHGKIQELRGEENEFLVKLCWYVYRQGKYTEQILMYLGSCYGGTAEEMEQLWKSSREFCLDTRVLEEHLLGQMLFTEHYVAHTFDIFESYELQGSSSLIRNAYIAYFSYVDFVLEQYLPETFFGYLEKAVQWERELPMICRLSCLRYLSGKDSWNEWEETLAREQFYTCIQEERLFGFLKPLAERLSLAEELEHLQFIEYRSAGAKKVVLHFVLENPGEAAANYEAEQLYPVYPGIFVKPVTLFFGQTMTYFITEIGADGSEKTTDYETLSGDREQPLVSGTKFCDIYELSRSLGKKELVRLEEQLLAFKKKQYLAEHLFQPR